MKQNHFHKFYDIISIVWLIATQVKKPCRVPILLPILGIPFVETHKNEFHEANTFFYFVRLWKKGDLGSVPKKYESG